MNPPKFMQNVKITKKEAIEISNKVLSNWSSVVYVSTNSSEHDLLRYLHAAVMTKKRPEVLDRLKSRFNTIRKKREAKELRQYAKSF